MHLRFVCCCCCCWNNAYRLAAAGLNTPGGTNGEKADFMENVGDGAGTAIGAIESSPVVNIASIAWTTSPRYFCNRVSTSLRRRVGNTLQWTITLRFDVDLDLSLSLSLFFYLPLSRMIIWLWMHSHDVDEQKKMCIIMQDVLTVKEHRSVIVVLSLRP